MYYMLYPQNSSNILSKENKLCAEVGNKTAV